MGTTITSLHLYGVERDYFIPFLSEGGLLRDVNPPWLSIVPSDDADRLDPSRMERLAKNLTKQQAEAYALLFFYFDDDAFACKLFKAGKRVAGCQSNQSWAKLGKALNLLFDDESPAKALRYASRCFSLDEQVQLLEETLGVALLDFPEEAPRIVPRGDTLVRAIKARESALRKRPNQCILTEVPFEAWPEAFQAKQRLYDILRPYWQQIHVTELLGEIASQSYIVPYHEHIAAYPVYNMRTHSSTIYLFNVHSGQPAQFILPNISVASYSASVLWATKTGASVFLVCRFLRTRIKDTPFGPTPVDENTRPYLVCFDADGQELWKFCVEEERDNLQYVHTAPDGTITLYSGYHSIYHEGKTDHFDGYVYQIDGETGALLRSRRFPASEDKMIHLMRVDAIDGFIYSAMGTGDLIVLDADLREVARWRGFPYKPYTSHTICGSVICDTTISGEFILLDLRNGKISRVHPEVPAHPIAVLSDGRILGRNDNGNRLTVFDEGGKVTSRHTVPGALQYFAVEDQGRVLLSEWRSSEDITFYCEESLDASSMHVWQLR